MCFWRASLGGADDRDDLAHPIMRRVRHVEAEDVHPRVNQRADHFRRTGGRAQRSYDFGFSHAVRF
jgi:hypothetical protein